MHSEYIVELHATLYNNNVSIAKTIILWRIYVADDNIRSSHKISDFFVPNLNQILGFCKHCP